MIAWVAMAGVIFLLVLPNFVFRFCFSLFLPIKNYDHSTIEELYFALTNTLLVFLMSFFVVSYFWSATNEIVGEFSFVLPIYYLAVVVEALLLGFLCCCYSWLKFKCGDTRFFKLYHAFAAKFLFRHIPEWHMILSDFGEYKATVLVDVMTVENHLYQGKVGTYFTDKEGQLTGIFIVKAKRFQLDYYLKDREANKAKPIGDYWKPIPGKNLYLLADKIINFNVRYEVLSPSESEMEQLVLKELMKSMGGQKLSVKVTISPPKE